MKLRALELEQFRKFARPVRLSGFGDGVNLLCGANEFGKSTLLEAIRGLLFERHGSGAQSIKRMQTWNGDAAPQLALEFEIEGGLWRIEKRFLHKPMARLTAPDGGRFDGDAAEETLQRVLGFGASGKKGATPGQMGVWGALWVTQQHSVLQADLSSDMARTTIANCLDAEVGVMTGNEKGQALMRAAREQLAQLLDGRDKPKGRYGQVTARLQSLGEELAALRERGERLASDTTSLRQKERLLARESDPAAQARDEDDLKQAQDRLQAARLHQQQVAAARAALALAVREDQDAIDEVAARVKRAGDIAAARGGLDAAIADGKTRGALIDAARAALADRREAMAMAQTRAAEAAAATRRSRMVVELARRVAELGLLRERLEAAERAQGIVNARTAELARNGVDATRIEVVRDCVRALNNARGAREAQATQIEFDLLPDRVADVIVAGRALGAGQHLLSVTEETELAIGGVGRIRVRPAIHDLSKLRKQMAAAEDALAAALAAVGCAHADVAERHFVERERLQRGLADAQAEVARLAPGDKSAALPPGIGPLRAHVDTMQQRVDTERAGLGEIAPPAVLAAQMTAAETEETQAAEAVVQARGAFDVVTEHLASLQVAAARADGQTSGAQADLARLAGDADAARARESDDDLTERRMRAEAHRLEQDRRLAALVREQPSDTPQAMQARVERYEQAIVNRRQTVRGLREDVIALRARIEAEGGNGLDEMIAAKARESDMLAGEQAALANEVAVLRLLLDTLVAAERQTKEQYLAPIIRRVTPYLTGLFPGVTVQCDDSLRITGLTRDGRGEEAFERLSDGTQEQIAVLARLAFAEMLIDQKKPAMVILDDALAYSDADRLERMFDIIAIAAAKMQILVLTCRDDLFARLGGNRLELCPLEPRG
jgi:energy-coupling factor transporter ATP-binding protein EcfA2